LFLGIANHFRGAQVKLRDLVLSTRRDRGLIEAPELASGVLDQLEPEDYRAALEQALPAFCRAVTASIRVPGPISPPAAPNAMFSAKVAATRDWWQRRLDEDYEGADGRKLLRDFTYDDLQHLADMLDRQAREKMARARGFRSLQMALTQHGVETVGDLPAEVLMPSLGAVAA
jgi:hypothetical protein